MEQISTEQIKEEMAVSNENRYDPNIVRQLVIDIAIASSVCKSDAKIFADALLEADLNGTSTHGISRLNIYIQRIRKGLINPTAELNIEQKRKSSLVVDAANGLGQVQAVKALDRLTSLAKETGIAACTIRNSQHFGALSYYCNRAAKNDMILLATTNCEPSMAPDGASEAYFGTNPLACSFPTGKGYPVKIDLATSLVARGNIIHAQKNGNSIPKEWALNKNGEHTTNAEEALEGTMLPMAGHKGYALALMVEIFSGVLTGSAFGPSIGSMYNDFNQKQNVGHFFCLIDISSFMDVEVFKERIDRMITEIKACQKRTGIHEIRIPGEHSYLKSIQNQERGIIIEPATLFELKLLCEDLNIDYNFD